MRFSEKEQQQFATPMREFMELALVCPEDEDPDVVFVNMRHVVEIIGPANCRILILTNGTEVGPVDDNVFENALDYQSIECELVYT